MVINNVTIEDFTKYSKVYTENTEKQISKQFQRLKDENYLEHAGATLYAEMQISLISNDLQRNLYGNPHAFSPSSKLSEDTVDQIRYRILNHFNTNPKTYSLIFTASATNALKTVAEYFDCSGTNTNDESGMFAYTQDNHTSVLGMRQYFPSSVCIKNNELNRILFNKKNVESDSNLEHSTNSLFVYPAQSNFSGRKYPLSWIKRIQDSGLILKTNTRWFCLLDAASFVGTNYLNLSEFQPDFVCVSFYKIFGYPTGLGALLVKNSSAFTLKKKYFGGGTVEISLSNERFHVFRSTLHESFEDGTLSFLSIISLQHCFNMFDQFNLNMEMISKHVFQLAQYTHHSLAVLHHYNGNPVVVLYSDNNFQDISQQGGIVNFNLLRENGDYVGFSEVLHLASLYNIHLRTGCFCNPGACQAHLNLTDTDVKNHFKAGHVCGDQHDLVGGVPTGSVRVSFGYMSTKKEADALLQMIRECFIKKPIVQKIPESLLDNHCNKDFRQEVQVESTYLRSENDQHQILRNIFLYPVKSCAAFPVTEKWEISSTGLKYDRQWMIVNHSGVCLTQKHEPRMCLISPNINLNKSLLTLSFPDFLDITIPLQQTEEVNIKGNLCQSKVCRDRVECTDCGDDIAHWLENVLNRPGLRLLQQKSDRLSKPKNIQSNSVELSLVNEAQFLLLNIRSIEWLNSIIEDPLLKFSTSNLIARFRPNFVITAKVPFEELEYKKLTIRNHQFKAVGPCSRCQMICIDPETGTKSAEPLKSLAANCKGNIKFGFYLQYERNIGDKCNKYLYINENILIDK